MSEKKIKVTSKKMREKLQQGMDANGWRILGMGGTQKAFMAPLVEYLRAKGIEVDGIADAPK